MIKSMTGYGAGKHRTDKGSVSVEIKSVNHRFLEISCRVPVEFSGFEDKIQTLVKKKIIRGKIYINLVEQSLIQKSGDLDFNIDLAKKYYKKLKKVKKEFNLAREIDLRDIVTFPGILNYKISDKNIIKAWPIVEKAIKVAIANHDKTRIREGNHLAQDLKKRISVIRKGVKRIDLRANANVKSHKRKLEKKIKELAGINPANNDRVETEVAIYAKNSDIAEELTRLSGHMIHFEKDIKKGKETGKTLDFIAQEMHREANTIGSKSNDSTISSSVIEIKSAIEKIREQVKNIE
jgi:uncharacterized protein (TIGR00255 family)